MGGVLCPYPDHLRSYIPRFPAPKTHVAPQSDIIPSELESMGMHGTTHKDRRQELIFFDAKNRRSITNLVPAAMVQEIHKLWRSEDRTLLTYGERRLMKELIRRGKNPTVHEQELRSRFWIEFDRIQTHNDRITYGMEMGWIIGNRYSKELFYTYFIKDHAKLAYLLTPIHDYAIALELALNAAIDNLVMFTEKAQVASEKGEMNLAVVDRYIKIVNVLMKQLTLTKFGDKVQAEVEQVLSDEPPPPEELTPKEELAVLAAETARVMDV